LGRGDVSGLWRDDGYDHEALHMIFIPRIGFMGLPSCSSHLIDGGRYASGTLSSVGKH